MAERYWLPKSKPWRLRLGGLWVGPKGPTGLAWLVWGRGNTTPPPAGGAGGVPEDLPVGRVGRMPAGIADRGPQDPGELAELRLDSPEAPSGEGRPLRSSRAVTLEGRGRGRTGVVRVPELQHVTSPLRPGRARRPARPS